MDRNREARRSTMAATNGLLKRRHRTTSLRESPEEDVVVELQEAARLRDRGTGKKDRERERLSRSKRRRADRLMHGSNREDAGEESSEDSVNDEEDEDDEDCGGSVRMLPPNPLSMTSISNHRKSFPPAKTFRTAASWKAADEMIGVLVPRKARSASTKRSHDSWTPTAGVGAAELIHRQASTSPVRPSVGSATASLGPASPSSSNPSARKKPKSNGPKLRPPKSSSKSSSAQDEIEIEIAEVLYGMMRQPQWPSKQEIIASDSLKFDSREVNKATSDSKSRVSSPISNSSSVLPLPSSILTQNSVSTITSISAMGPKRKRPRPNKYDDENPSIFSGRNGPIFSTTKPEADHAAKTEISPHNFKKSSGFLAENGRVAVNTGSSQVTQSSSEVQIEHIKPESYVLSDSNLLAAKSNGKDLGVTKEEPQSPKNETLIPILNHNNPDEKIPTKPHSSMVECENQREEKFQIDLMAPPPFRSSPERNVETDFVAVDPKSLVTEAEMETTMAKIKEDEKAAKVGRGEEGKVESKAKSDDVDSRNHPVIIKNMDLPVDLEKTERDAGYGGLSNNKLSRLAQKQQQQQQPSISDKAGQANSLPFPVSVAGWPTGLPPMGYVTPLPGVVSIDGSSVSSTAMQPSNLFFPQPQPKRCATHCYIARNICYHQQIARMNPFWPSAPGSASMFGAKHCNPNGLPSSDFHGNLSGKNVNSLQEKAQSLPIFSAQSAKDNKPPQPSTIVDVSQRKQILVQQSLPPGAPNNILGPAFIFPLSQQQAAAAASVRPAGSVKSPTSGTISSSASVSSSVSGPPTAAIAGPTMSFNYPNMPSNETQYLAILQNNGYSFPIPAHVGALPGYRGAHPPAMPFFNGSFYSSQMIHPPPSGQPQLSQQGPPSSIIAGGSSSNQKHLQSQQSRSHASGSYGGGGGNLQGFPSKNHSSQTLQLQQARSRQLETDIGGEESPSTADSRVSRSNINVYGQNFAMPIYSPPNFSSINSAVPIGSGGEKKHSQVRGGSKTGVEPSQAFALSFASINGASTTPGIDLSTIATNHPMFQNLPDVTRHNYQIMAAAQVAQQKKIYQDGNTMGGDNSSNVEEERKTSAGKTPVPTIGQSIAFSRTELSDTSASTIPGGTAMVDSSVRRPSGSVMPQVPSVISSPNAPNSPQQMQRNQPQLMLQKQQQFAAAAAAAAARNKTPPTSNGGGVYSDHLPSPSSMAAKFPNALSSFSQNLVQSNSTTSPAHSPQWKNSARATTTSQVPTQSVSSTASSTKTLLQQSNRPQQSHTQISFAANPKSSVQNQVQQSVSGQTPSPPLMVGSPTSSISKSAGGSPRLASSTPTGNKTGQAAVASQQIKNSQPLPNQKSILGNPHVTSSSNSGNKTQLAQQQHLSKQSLQQAQLFFSHPYMQAQASHSTSPSTPSAGSGYYLQRRRGEPQPAAHGQPSSTSGMLSLSPITLDPAKAVAVASPGSNVKSGSGLPSTAILHAAQYSASHPPGMPAGFPYIHTVSTAALQVKQAEQKQPAVE